MSAAPFKVGDIVETVKGAKFWGAVKSVYEVEPGNWRADVYAIDAAFYGTIHVYPAVQLALKRTRTLDEWHEDAGFVVWWTWQDGEWLGEPSYIGSPLCSDWPGYHTHWTEHPAFPPALSASQPGEKPMDSAVLQKVTPASIQRPVAGKPVFAAIDRDTISIRAGTVVGDITFADQADLVLQNPVAGADYVIVMDDGWPVAVPCGDGVPDNAIGGFHYAPGSNATARSGGDTTPAVNPFSIWDAGFRPACPDPRGMALVEQFGRRFWCDIYLLGTDHLTKGTSRFGEQIADGRSLPAAIDGKGRTKKLDYATAVAIYGRHGKQLLGAEEFFAATYGVTERSSAEDDSETVQLDAPRTSQAGIMQATGNLWVWGTDGDPDNPRPSLFGGSWLSGGDAGSRYASLGVWPDDSGGTISARGRSDHLTLD